MKCIPRDIFPKDDYLSSLICPFGYGIFRDPVALPCQHVFCRQCIESSNEGRGCGNCPTCGEPWSKEQLRHQIEVAELISQSTCKCPQCDWTGQYQNLEKHMKSGCQNAFVPCQFGCGITFPMKYVKDHEGQCRMRRVECASCKKTFAQREIADHESFCPEREVDCPICQKKVKLYDVEIHTRTMHVDTPVCMFAFAGCYFVAKPGEKSLETHYKECAEKHLDMLSLTVSQLQDKVDRLEHEGADEKQHTAVVPRPPSVAGPKVYAIRWSNGLQQVMGTKKGGWSFFLTMQAIPGNFVAKLRITALGNDSNTWKMCLGVFNSNKFQPGSWDKYKNGWGYILGNGNKIHENPSVSYGASYATGDNIWIEHKQKNITFYKNGVSQGVAFSGITGPFYIAVALSDSGHAIDLIEAVEIPN